MLYFALIFVIFIVLYPLSIIGRTGHPKSSLLPSLRFAHRGLFDNGQGVPENSAAAFRLAAKHPGLGCEFDVHLTKDDQLVVIHDSVLTRICGTDQEVEKLTLAQLQALPLFGTKETAPTLRQVLDILGPAKAPLLVELKCTGNAGPLAAAALAELKDYPAPYVVESFDPRAILWLRKNAPDICRGQLSCDFWREPVKLPGIMRTLMTHLTFDFGTQPDFIAYRFEDRKKLAPTIAKKLWRLPAAHWTIRTQADYDTAVAEGATPIFEGFLPRDIAGSIEDTPWAGQ